MSIRLKSGYNPESNNKFKLPILYKLYEYMPNGMNKRSQLSNLTRLAIQILEHGNRK